MKKLQPQCHKTDYLQELQKWRRFEVVTQNCAQINELNGVLARHQLTRWELAVILATLRIRSEFPLKDFDT